ncbi:MAG: hypothetical protein M0C28_34420 [Candidatus Moduliflexus flocculans]|nr:hypothetical protein [Candidatus Moduliflexus flocculans]
MVFRWHLPLSIDFTGGSLLEVQLRAGGQPQTSEILAVYEDGGHRAMSRSRPPTQAAYIIRSSIPRTTMTVTRFSPPWERKSVTVTVVRFDSVGPSIGEQVTSRGTHGGGRCRPGWWCSSSPGLSAACRMPSATASAPSSP